MKVYIGNDLNLISKIDRLVKLKATLGVCAWAGDFSSYNYDVDTLIEYIDNELSRIQHSLTVEKELSEEEDLKYFELVNKDEKTQRILETGVITNDYVESVDEEVLHLLGCINNKITSSSFCWVV